MFDTTLSDLLNPSNKAVFMAPIRARRTVERIR